MFATFRGNIRISVHVITSLASRDIVCTELRTIRNGNVHKPSAISDNTPFQQHSQMLLLRNICLHLLDILGGAGFAAADIKLAAKQLAEKASIIEKNLVS